ENDFSLDTPLLRSRRTRTFPKMAPVFSLGWSRRDQAAVGGINCEMGRRPLARETGRLDDGKTERGDDFRILTTSIHDLGLISVRSGRRILHLQIWRSHVSRGGG